MIKKKWKLQCPFCDLEIERSICFSSLLMESKQCHSGRHRGGGFTRAKPEALTKMSVGV